MSTLATLSARYLQAHEPLRSERRLELVVLVLLAVVVLQLLALGASSVGGAAVTPVLPTSDSMRVEQPVEPGAISASESLQLQSRPVFWASRRATSTPSIETEVVEAGEGTPARQLQQLQVTGVFGGGEQGGAIVAYKGNRMRLLIGDEIDGWALLSVAPGEAVFASAGSRDVRRLLPQPVVAAASAGNRSASPASARSSQTQATAPANTPRPQNQKKPARPTSSPAQQGTLSLGG
ncbi:MAG: hypothetical protein AAGG55_14710 [Pseudomonadota bacterium]